MKRKRILKFLTIPFLIIAVTVVALLKEEDGIEYEQRCLKINLLLEQYRNILRRHPDLELTSQQEYLSMFKQKPEKEQAAGLAELKTACKELAVETLEKTIGKAMEDMYQSGLQDYKTFSPNGFKDFYDSFQYTNTAEIEHPPHIIGNTESDRRIIRLAEKRGYRLRSEADANRLVAVENQRLQPEASESWEKLKKEALNRGIRLGLISGFRSVSRQRQIFLNLLKEESLREAGREYRASEIALGQADEIINRILKTSSIPGYSKHHTGYTLDITDLTSGMDYTEFAQTEGFRWISANNYLNAKRFGFIPSYPEGATHQGPEPEAWEFVWVGEKVLKVAFHFRGSRDDHCKK